jgi:hypothetical protein
MYSFPIKNGETGQQQRISHSAATARRQGRGKSQKCSLKSHFASSAERGSSMIQPCFLARAQHVHAAHRRDPAHSSLAKCISSLSWIIDIPR